MVGLLVSASQLNQRAGQIAQDLRRNFEDAVQLNAWLLANPVVSGTDPLTLEPFSLSAGDASTLRTAYADLSYMKGASFDSSADVKKLWGIGS